jgi:hypothetical protein
MYIALAVSVLMQLYDFISISESYLLLSHIHLLQFVQDLGAYKFLGKKTEPEIAEACIRPETQYYGSHSLDLSFRDLLYKLQKEEGVNLDPPNLQHYMDTFAEFKSTYRGEGTGSNLVYFDCFDPSDHRKRLVFCGNWRNGHQ